MFSDPLSTTHLGVAATLPRISIQGQSSTYSKSDGVQTVKISHQTTKNRVRRLVRFEARVGGLSPLTGEVKTELVNAYLVIDAPHASVWTDSDGQVKKVVRDLQVFIVPAGDDANLIKVLGSEI